MQAQKLKPEKKSSWLPFFLVFGAFAVMWYFIFYYLSKQINYVEDTIFYGTPHGSYWSFYSNALFYGLITYGIYYSIKEGIKYKTFKEFKSNVVPLLIVGSIPVVIGLPFLYLGMTHAVVITEDEIRYKPYWSFNGNEYSWQEDIKVIELDYTISDGSRGSSSDSFIGWYIFHFEDGKKVDVWESAVEGTIDNIKEINTLVDKKGIPYYVTDVPSDEEINKFFNKKDGEFVRKLFAN